jgi:uncharacterized protein (TIGR00730 family)
VFCSASQDIDPAHVELATQVGTALGERGWSLVSGGGAISMMGALARAARSQGAHTTGVIPQALVHVEITDHDADDLVVTDDMRSRKALMDARADAFLALPGGLGTLEELLEIWVARTLGMHDKPVVVLDPDGLFDPLQAQVQAFVDQGFLRQSAADVLIWTRSVDQAMEAIEFGLGHQAHLSPSGYEVLEDQP